MSESDLSTWSRETLARNPALLVSLLYLTASLIGLVYSWAFLRAFEVNVFRYADISDFLLASLKEPFTWLLAVAAVAAVALDNGMSLRVQRRGPSRFMRWYGNKRYRQVNYLVLVVLVLSFLFSFASINEEKIRDGKGEVFSVSLSDSSPPKRRVMLGTTARYVFLFDQTTGGVDIHPIESILMLRRVR